MDTDFIPEETPPEPVFRAVVINDVGPNKIQFIKLLRQVAQLDLKAAKDLAEKPVPFVLVICDEPTAAQFQSLAADLGASCELADYDETTTPAITNDQPFIVGGPGKTGCAAAVLALAAATAGMIYGLIVLLGRI